MLIRPIKVKPLDNYRLLIDFTTGERKIFDVKPYLKHAFFAKLQKGNAFRQVYVNEVTVEWANGCDIAPHELYDYGVPVQNELE